jgi:hypothetical protein
VNRDENDIDIFDIYKYIYIMPLLIQGLFTTDVIHDLGFRFVVFAVSFALNAVITAQLP